jgi:hypothetical protein
VIADIWGPVGVLDSVMADIYGPAWVIDSVMANMYMATGWWG